MTNPQQPATTRPLTVLVVDDEAGIRSVITRALTSWGHQVVEASDGADGWQRYCDAPPDLVVSDLMMPKVDGFELLRRVHEVKPDAEFVLVTAFADTQKVVEALRLGVSNVIEKPFLLAEFARQIEPSLLRLGLTLERDQLTAALAEETQLRERAQRLAALGRLLAGMAHEIHNPLTFLKGNLEIVRGQLQRLKTNPGVAVVTGVEPVLEEADLLLADAEYGAGRIRDLVERIKQFSAHPRHGIATEIPLARTMQNSVTLASAKCPEGVHLDFPQPPERVLLHADAQALESCFSNLLVNAYEALPQQGRVSFQAALFPFDTGNQSGWVEITVDDDGPGIPSGLVGEAMTPFFTRKEGGTGLGLSIAHEAARKYGGVLNIETSPERGTRAVVRLPYVLGDAGANAPIAPPTAGGPGGASVQPDSPEVP